MAAPAKGKSGLPKREQQAILIIGVLGVGVLWLYFAYIVGPLNRASGQLNRQIQDGKGRLQILEAVASREGQLKTQHQQLSRTVGELRQLLPAEGDVSTIIQQLTGLANQAQVKILTISPQRVQEAEPEAPRGRTTAPVAEPAKVYEDVFIAIDALAGYHQLGMFLSLVEAGEKPMRIASLKVSTNPKELRRANIKLLISTYLTKANAPPTKRPAS